MKLLTTLGLALGIPALTCTAASSVEIAGRHYTSQGLVGVGRLPANTKDKFNETFGSFSAFAFQPGTWQRAADGSYSGTLFTQPDRGYNVDATTNYTPRFNKISLTFRPASSASTQDQVQLTIADTIRYTELDGTPFTSLDPAPSSTGAVRAGFPALPAGHNGRLSLDAEGIVVNADGTLWISDEYGPYIFKFNAAGQLTKALRPPEALIPKRANVDSFASNNPAVGQPAPSPTNPTTGRQNNQGLEGLSVSPDGRTLHALLQSATRQDGGTGGTGPRRYTRLLSYDLTTPEPTLKSHVVLELPTYRNASNALVVPAQSEIAAVSDTQILVLARDGNGRGTANATSLYRSVLVYEVSGATNLLGTAYETAATPVAPGGALVAGITPARGQVLINMNESTELAKFGLTNGPSNDTNNLSEKWEALALVPALDPAQPNDWFLFVGNDNDFMTTTGFQDGQSYAAAVENDNMILVYRLTLPSRLMNLSSRALTESGNGAHIIGFTVDGTKPKSLLVRGVGPGLTQFGVTNTLANPELRVFNAAGLVLASNDDWGTQNLPEAVRLASQRSGAFALAEGSKDAALIVALSPGSYLVQVSANGSGSGVSLVELYEIP